MKYEITVVKSLVSNNTYNINFGKDNIKINNRIQDIIEHQGMQETLFLPNINNIGVLIYRGKYKERDCYTFYVFFNGNKEKRMLIGVSYKQAYTEDLLKFVVYNWLLKGNVVFVE